jgi:hypothetical protein
MRRATGPADDRLQHFRLVRNRGILGSTPFRRVAIAQQAGGDAAEPVAAMGDDRAPRGTGTTGARREHNGWAMPALLVVDTPARIHKCHVAPDWMKCAADRSCLSCLSSGTLAVTPRAGLVAQRPPRRRPRGGVFARRSHAERRRSRPLPRVVGRPWENRLDVISDCAGSRAVFAYLLRGSSLGSTYFTSNGPMPLI